jgi:hypothetical protein
MDTTTSLITLIGSVCIVLFGIAAVGASLYGILVWFPAQRKKKEDALKATGRQGEATILRVPDHILKPYRSNRSMFTPVSIGLEIRVLGMETYEVDKVFTMPTSALRMLQVGKVVPVWVDPQSPRDLEKIVIDLE